ncbi:phosphatidylethanolamine-binding protein [Mycotypha africana]|uniref:phosphatidylethanolamine-binding protein n=1 Tax=Mycotypha africana TaxID=64632 RepID=UPI0023019103|nr:phosphatidylethanolamine-binding protein [Mycotypha africana]KAI8992075.1 phosphatidylethanolamine-binding protein [Mycotypha africana]
MSIATTDLKINAALQRVQLIPDVLSDVTSSTLLQIIFKESGKEVLLGNNFTSVETKEQPTINLIALSESDYYTLVMMNPDAPSRHDQKVAPWRHWIVVNIADSDVKNSVSQAENHHTPYIGPGPGENTGIHRYTFLLYK